MAQEAQLFFSNSIEREPHMWPGKSPAFPLSSHIGKIQISTQKGTEETN